MKTIKIMDGIKLEVDGEFFEFRDEPWDNVMDAINMYKDEALRSDLFRKFFAFGFLDLSEAYPSHTVKISAIPVSD